MTLIDPVQGWLRSGRCDTGSCVEVAWMKSPYSGADGCVEVGAAGRCESGNCVEVSADAGEVLIRDSKLGEASPVLRFTMAEWRAFVDGIAGIDGRLQEMIGAR